MICSNLQVLYQDSNKQVQNLMKKYKNLGYWGNMLFFWRKWKDYMGVVSNKRLIRYELQCEIFLLSIIKIQINLLILVAIFLCLNKIDHYNA